MSRRRAPLYGRRLRFVLLVARPGLKAICCDRLNPARRATVPKRTRVDPLCREASGTVRPSIYRDPPMATALPKKIRREDVSADDCLCNHCTAKCCKYFALPIDTPTEQKDFDYIRWYLLHEAATVFIEDDTWYLLVHTQCKHLQPDNRCGIYETRPQICRDYSTDGCEYEDDYVYERYFETPEQVEEFVEAFLPPKRGKVQRSRKPPLLKIVH